MDAYDWLKWLLLGAVLGLFGQTARVVSGLKKLYDRRGKQTPDNHFDLPRFCISLFLGSLAGMLAALSQDPSETIDRKTLLLFFSAGYAGADFIEAFTRKSGISH